MNENNYMELALKQAKKAEMLDEVPVGAVLIDENNGEIISAHHNEILLQNNVLRHAEIIVIEQAYKLRKSKYLLNTSIYVTLEPCAMCAAAISEVRIKKIYFGAYDEKKGSLESIMKIYNTKNYFVPEVYGGINETECSTMLKKFFQEKRQ